MCPAWARTFVPWIAWNSGAAGMRGRRTLLTYFPASWLGRPRKYMFFVPSAHFGRRRRYSIRSSTSGKMPPQLSRHHYDLSCLCRHEHGQAAMKDIGLIASVVEHKRVSFREDAARYDLAQPGSLWVCPPDAHVAQIRSDYWDMREMFIVEAPPFDQVIADLKELEARGPGQLLNTLRQPRFSP